MFERLSNFLDAHLGAFAEKLNKNDVIAAISAGMMGTMPITLGVAILSILLYLPIPAWQGFLTNTGLLDIGMMALTVTNNMLAPYVLVSMAHAYAKIKKISVMNSIVLAMGIFFILMPLTVVKGDYGNSYTISTAYLGSNGIFIAMILGLLIPALYSRLIKHVGIKLPATVPPMVTDSLSPTFVAMILFGCAFLVKFGFSLTPFGNFFDFFNTIVGAPVMKLGASVPALIITYTFSNLLWFFGIHPSAILSVYAPAMMTAASANVQAYMAGTPASQLPYLGFGVVYMLLAIGGSGVMIGLSLSMLTAKSDRYKALRNLAFIPSLFNISEPIMFGLPVVLNPIFFIPMVIAVPVVGTVGYLMVKMGLANGFNPLIQLPWIMPAPIAGLLNGGFGLLVFVIVGIVLSCVIYYPFFRMADKKACKEEAEIRAAEENK